MATKPYPQIEETPCVVNEPIVAYHSASKATNVYQATDTERESLMRAEWLRPHTVAELHAICDEAEADDEANRLLSSDFVYAEMERLNPWLCK